MRPKSTENTPQNDLFRMRLDNLLDQRHELVRLADLIDWSVFDEAWGKLFPATTGAPAIPTRMIAGLHYLKHLYGLSDERVVARWVENPYWQYFCGETIFQHTPPIHPTSMTRWRKRIGAEGCEWLLTQTIEAGKASNAMDDRACERVIVDTTVQEKAVAYPTDSRLYEAARRRLVTLTKQHGVVLRQNYNRVGKRLLLKINRYGHARQYKRMRHHIKLLRTRVGRVVRDIERQLADRPELKPHFAADLALTKRWLNQQRQDKNKLYSLHAPEVECIAKGKVHKRYEFGVKASFAVTHEHGYVIGARSYPDNPYDGHTLADPLQQVEALTGIKPKRVFVDRGYRGHGIEDTQVLLDGQKRGVTRHLKRQMKRRAAIEPEIGHMKSDGLLDRNYLHGTEGDAMNVLLVAAGHNLRKLLNHIRAFWLWILSEFIGHSTPTMPRHTPTREMAAV